MYIIIIVHTIPLLASTSTPWLHDMGPVDSIRTHITNGHDIHVQLAKQCNIFFIVANLLATAPGAEITIAKNRCKKRHVRIFCLQATGCSSTIPNISYIYIHSKNTSL